MTAEIAKYRCKSCGAVFQQEHRYIKHQCKQMKKELLLKEPIGQAAWIFYQKWMKSYNKIAANANAFLHSKYFNSFVRFAEFAKRVRIVDTEAFIHLMRESDISPTIWTNDQVFSRYLEYIDKKLSPRKLAEITINTLLDYAEDYDVEVSDVFEKLTPNEVIQLLRERRLSPWFLLNSPKFTQFFVNKTSVDHRVILESIIRPAHWKKKFESSPEDLKLIKTLVSGLKL